MDRLKKVLIRISNDISKKEEILQAEYGKTDLLKIWKTSIQNAPRRLSKSWNRLFMALQLVLKMSYPNNFTFNRMVSKFREPIRLNKDLDGEIYKQSLIMLGRTREEAAEEKEQYKNKVAARNAGRGDYPVLYVEDVFKAMDEFIKSKNPYELALAIELATGSRSVEVFKVSKYFEVPNQPNQIKVQGLAKDKDNKNNLKNVIIIRNLNHLTAPQVLEAIEEIRSSFNFDNKSNEQIATATNKRLNDVFNEYIKPLFTPQQDTYLKTLSSHKTRYIAGYISYLTYGKPNKIPEESYIQQQLGHLNPESTKSYLGINIQYREKKMKNIDADTKDIITDTDLKEIRQQINNLKEEIKEKCSPDEVKYSTQGVGSVDLSEFKNKRVRSQTETQKIDMIIAALNALKDANIYITQKELGRRLQYGSVVLSKAYGKYRELNTPTTEN
jgi:hypothetical protein